jgi:hypothetical protein
MQNGIAGRLRSAALTRVRQPTTLIKRRGFGWLRIGWNWRDPRNTDGGVGEASAERRRSFAYVRAEAMERTALIQGLHRPSQHWPAVAATTKVNPTLLFHSGKMSAGTQCLHRHWFSFARGRASMRYCPRSERQRAPAFVRRCTCVNCAANWKIESTGVKD